MRLPDDSKQIVGFIGAGNMAETLIKGLLAQEEVVGQSIMSGLRFADLTGYVCC